MKTSNRISLWFTVSIGILMLIFIIFLNIVFFASWRNNWGRGRGMQQQFLQTTGKYLLQNTGQHLPMFAIKREFVVNKNDFMAIDDLSRLRYAPNIYNINDNRFVIREGDEEFVMTEVTQNVNRQNELLIASGVLWLGFVLITYFLSHLFVSRSLHDLYTLANSVRDTDIKTLSKTHTLTHLPHDDELNILAGSIDTMQKTISEQVVSMKDFVSHVSHEFKTPLMVLQSTTDVAEKTGDVTAVIPQYKKTIKQMQTTLDTLTYLARYQSEALLHTENVNIIELIKDIVARLQKIYTSKDIVCEIQNNASESGNVFIKSHPGSIELIVANIIDNAFKYTPHGGVIKIILDDIYMSVEDSGVGIPQEAKSHIWKPFWQVDKNREDGVGLGLHIVKTLVETLGWEICLDSKEGQGTKMSLYWIK